MAWSRSSHAKTAATAPRSPPSRVPFGTNLSSGTKILAAVAVSLGDARPRSPGSPTPTGTPSPWSAGRPLARDPRRRLPVGDGHPRGRRRHQARRSRPRSVTGSSPTWSISIAEVSGLAVGNPLTAMTTARRAVSTGTGGSTTGSPSYTSTASNEFLVSVYGDNGGPETLTKPSALTLDPPTSTATRTPTSPSPTGTPRTAPRPGRGRSRGPGDWGTLLVAFKLAASAAPSSTPPTPARASTLPR